MTAIILLAKCAVWFIGIFSVFALLVSILFALTPAERNFRKATKRFWSRNYLDGLCRDSQLRNRITDELTPAAELREWRDAYDDRRRAAGEIVSSDDDAVRGRA